MFSRVPHRKFCFSTTALCHLFIFSLFALACWGSTSPEGGRRASCLAPCVDSQQNDSCSEAKQREQEEVRPTASKSPIKAPLTPAPGSVSIFQQIQLPGSKRRNSIQFCRAAPGILMVAAKRVRVSRRCTAQIFLRAVCVFQHLPGHLSSGWDWMG